MTRPFPRLTSTIYGGHLPRDGDAAACTAASMSAFTERREAALQLQKDVQQVFRGSAGGAAAMSTHAQVALCGAFSDVVGLHGYSWQ